MKKLLGLVFTGLLLFACGDDGDVDKDAAVEAGPTIEASVPEASAPDASVDLATADLAAD